MKEVISRQQGNDQLKNVSVQYRQPCNLEEEQ